MSLYPVVSVTTTDEVKLHGYKMIVLEGHSYSTKKISYFAIRKTQQFVAPAYGLITVESVATRSTAIVFKTLVFPFMPKRHR